MDDANRNDGAAANGVCFPYDVLLDLLRRLPRRALARSRRVCRAWRAIVDAHGLVIPHAFPRDEFPGLYANYFLSPPRSAFFAPPASRSGVDPAARFRRPLAWKDSVLDPYVWTDWAYVQQHCNGLLLVRDRYFFGSVNDVHVCNPATTWRARLPSPPRPWTCDVEGMFLAFDPAVSRHHEVFMFPQKVVPSLDKRRGVFKKNVLSLLVFSSRTRRWENQQFAPGRCAPGHLYDVVTTPCGSKWRFGSGEYWRGSLYVHCHSGILVILRCSEKMYDMVKLPDDPPADNTEEHKETLELPKGSVLANYEGGVRYVMPDNYRLLVWVLSESTHGQLEWVLEHEADLRPHDYAMKLLMRKSKPRMEIEWQVADTREELNSLPIHYNNDDDDTLGSREGSEYSWNSDKHNFIHLDENVVADDLGTSKLSCKIIGFHPHKNALLLHLRSAVVVYHLDSSSMQYLGEIFRFRGAFPYRPCYFDILPPKESPPSYRKANVQFQMVRSSQILHVLVAFKRKNYGG